MNILDYIFSQALALLGATEKHPLNVPRETSVLDSELFFKLKMVDIILILLF